MIPGKILGILGLLAVICIYTALRSDQFLTAGNIEKIVHRTALFGILGVGVAFVIITGGIDLSIGSMVCLVGVLLPFLLTQYHWSPCRRYARTQTAELGWRPRENSLPDICRRYAFARCNVRSVARE